jgi:hypothetical protein
MCTVPEGAAVFKEKFEKANEGQRKSRGRNYGETGRVEGR